MMKLLLAAALMLGPSFAEKTKTARPALANPPTAFEECDPTDLGSFAGKPYDEALKDRAIEVSGSKSALVLRPGEAMNMRAGLQRVILRVGDDGKVISARCG